MSTNLTNTAALALLQAENTKLRAACSKLRDTNAELGQDNVKYRHNYGKLRKIYEAITSKLVGAGKDNVRLREVASSGNDKIKSLHLLLEHARERIETQDKLIECMEKTLGSEMANPKEESEVLEGAELLAEAGTESSEVILDHVLSVDGDETVDDKGEDGFATSWCG